ncbi:LYP1 Lysine-specific permease [Candida maltosa Xu316]
MISLGGIIGTGLFIGIRVTLLNGPIISLLSYIYISMMCYYIIQAVGEMSIYMPINGSLCQFQFIYISDPIGIMNNVIYWISWSVTLALELSLIYNILQYWDFGDWFYENEVLVIFCVWLVLTLINLYPVNNYGNIESVITVFKIVFLIGWINVGLMLMVFGDGGKEVGFKNWNKDLIWGIDHIKVIENPIASKMVNILSSLVTACFTFQSIESVAICSGEIKDVHKNLPKAIRYVVMRIIFCYIFSLFLLTLMIPCNDPRLIGDDDNGILSSPFLIGLINLGVNSSSYLLNFFNFIILISMISAANSNIYFGSRCLISMVEEDYFPEFFGKTTSSGVPVNAVLLTSSIGLISLLSKFKTVDVFFQLLINLCSTSGLLMWLFISISYLQFRKALVYNSIDHQKLYYVASFPMQFFSYFTIVSIIVIIFGNGIVNFWDFNLENFISCYATSMVLVVGSVTLSYLWGKPLIKPISDIDIFTNQSEHAFK